jgi:hypothetical protein
MVCWQKDGYILKTWNDEMTGGGNKPHYVWAPYLSTPSPYQFTKEKAVAVEAIQR